MAITKEELSKLTPEQYEFQKKVLFANASRLEVRMVQLGAQYGLGVWLNKTQQRQFYNLNKKVRESQAHLASLGLLDEWKSKGVDKWLA